MDKLIDALKKALLEGGLDEGSDSYKKVIGSKEFEGLKKQLEKESPTSFDEFLKLPDFKSEFDRQISKAVQSRESNLREKYDFKEKDGKDPNDGNKETEAMKQIRELTERLDKSEQKNLLNSRRATAEKLLKEKGIPSAFLKHFDLNGEADIDSQIEDVEKVFNDTRQEIINGSVKGTKLPAGSTETKVTDEEALAMVQRMR